MIDALATKDLKKSARELHRLLDSGEAELKILTMIVYQFRNLLIVKDQVSRGVTSQWDMAKKAGLHPFVAQKTLVQCKNYSFDDLKAIYKMLLDYDLKMKTGQLDPKTGLDLLVVKLCE
jgi:DNA polymerase-3 subunit delta